MHFLKYVIPTLISLAFTSSAPAVINGQAANEQRFEAVGALKIGSNVDVSCTATLIAANWIVTADHCTYASESNEEEGNGDYLPPEQYEFRLGNDFKKPTHTVRLKRWVHGPQMNGTTLDIAFGELAGPINDVRPLSVASPRWISGDFAGFYIHIGYGVIEAFSNKKFPLTNKRQMAYLTVTAADGNALLNLFGTKENLESYIASYHPQSLEADNIDSILQAAELIPQRYVHAWDARGRTNTTKIEIPPDGWQDTCFGDSGGPLLREYGSTLSIVGVVSHGMDRICSSMGTSFTVFGPEVQDLMRQLGI